MPQKTSQTALMGIEGCKRERGSWGDSSMGNARSAFRNASCGSFLRLFLEQSTDKVDNAEVFTSTADEFIVEFAFHIMDEYCIDIGSIINEDGLPPGRSYEGMIFAFKAVTGGASPGRRPRARARDAPRGCMIHVIYPCPPRSVRFSFPDVNSSIQATTHRSLLRSPLSFRAPFDKTLSTSIPSQACYILHLPTEIRLRIFEFVFLLFRSLALAAIHYEIYSKPCHIGYG